jgi:hypothetical protein
MPDIGPLELVLILLLLPILPGILLLPFLVGALTSPCRQCGRRVRSGTPSCPRCGAERPAG